MCPLVLRKAPEHFGGTMQIQLSMKKEARILRGGIIVFAVPPVTTDQATDRRFIQT